ncbi:fumarylacetoacetate hydrolase family protein [Thermodesulfobacteriota bacterium]
MKIAQFYKEGQIKLGFIKNDHLVPLNFHGDMIDFIQSGQDYNLLDDKIPLDKIEFAPPVSRPSKIIGIGLNYLDHIRESKGEAPEIPLIFAKFPSSLTGHKHSITWNRDLTKKVDFEAELVVVIGKGTYNCPEEKSMEAVFGYTCGNDVSARDLQFGDGQWVRGKTLDNFCPIGPWIITRDEIEDPHSLDIRSTLNGKVMQESNTDLMLFKIPQLISFLSNNFTLIPGDIILTGTPHGVGAFRKPPIYMADGDEIIVEIENIGRLVNTCKTV